ncbi:beta-sandwich lipoprotein, partial [Acinetobacter sichuanensis]
MKKRLLAVSLMCAVAMVGCSRDAQVASKNLSYAADNFELDRRVVFYNGITGEYILT